MNKSSHGRKCSAKIHILQNSFSTECRADQSRADQIQVKKFNFSENVH